VESLLISADEARRFYDAGSVATAEIICRQALQKNGSDAPAWELLGRIALDLSRPDKAAEYFNAAAWIAPSAESTEGLAAARAASEHHAPVQGSRFLLIKAWGNGFWSDVDQVLGGLLLAEMTGRTPIVYWGKNSRFAEPGHQNAWDLYYEPVSSTRIEDLIGKSYRFFPSKWNDANLREENVSKLAGPGSRLGGVHYSNRDEEVAVLDFHTGVAVLVPWLEASHPMAGKPIAEVYRYLIARHLRLRAEIQQGIESFAGWNFAGGPIVAAHVRGSDKFIEDPQLQQKIAAYPQVIAQFAARHPDTRVFLLTDSQPVRDDFARRYGDRLITTDALRTASDHGLHYQELPRRQLAIEVITDTYLAARCKWFVGLGSSNVSCMIYHLKAWPVPDHLVIGPIMTHQSNPYLYMNHAQLERFLPKEHMDKLRKYAEQP
jgi:hypothetical protein